MTSVAHLCRIEINRPGGDFFLDFQIDWDASDHDLNVAFKDWQFREIMLEG